MTAKTRKKARKKTTRKANRDAILGIEKELWQAACKLQGNLDAADYKHVVLGLIFLKYISDTFEEKYARLKAMQTQGSDPEDRDEYTAENIFWVPKKARWSVLEKAAKQPEIGQVIDDAMRAIERDNKSLKGVLPKDFGKPALDKRRLGELIDLFSTVELRENKAKDILGRVYEYFLSMFASAEGKRGGQFYTARCVVRLLVEMLAPYKGRVYDPCCGSGGMFVQSEKFVTEHASGNGNGGKAKDAISIYGQESNPTTWRLAKMNLAIRGIENNLGKEPGDSFHHDLHKTLKADFLLANPPFNMKDWGSDRLQDDVRWKYGVPPAGNANFAWVQHFIHHLLPSGMAGFVLANGSMSSGAGGEGEIRKGIIEDGLVDCMVALPGQLFYSTQIPVCLWFLARNRSNGRFRDRSGETLFIDARKLGEMTSRVHRELTDKDIARIAGTYHAWRGDKGKGKGKRKKKYKDIPGFCESATREEIAEHGYVLTPGRYVGAEAAEDDGMPFEEKMKELTAQLAKQMAEGKRLDRQIRANLKKLGFPVEQ